jgi:Omp85 superfamily domain
MQLVLLLLALCVAPNSRVATAFTLTNPNSWPLIPIPEVVTDPYAGTTVGLMSVFLRLNSSQQIETIIAPDVNYNTILGPGGTLRYLAYPSADTQWYAIGGGSEKSAYSVESDYASGMERSKWFSLEGHFFSQRDPTQRFFGLGNGSRFRHQTNYAVEQIYADAIVGLNLTPNLQIALREQPRFVRIFHGAISTLPFTGKLFPTLKGLDGGSELLNELVGSYHTRDSLQIPTNGGLIALSAGAADRSLLSSASYSEFAADLRRYLPIGKRITLAGQLYVRYVPAGAETPFWAMSWLGGDGPGESSLLGLPVSYEQTWRGGGAGRFIDNNLFLTNLEVRVRVYELDLFNTHGIAELAPFVDLGRVFHNVSTVPFTNLHPAGGIGFRAIVMPFVVAFVDFGYGPNGTAVFSGINYPF